MILPKLLAVMSIFITSSSAFATENAPSAGDNRITRNSAADYIAERTAADNFYRYQEVEPANNLADFILGPNKAIRDARRQTWKSIFKYGSAAFLLVCIVAGVILVMSSPEDRGRR